MLSNPRAVISAGSGEAAATGADVLARHGNAVDAAIAASAVQCVRELPWCGLGGDGFALISKPDRKPEALIGAGAAPRALADVSATVTRLPRYGPLSVSVPGLVDSWWRLWKRYGTLPFSDLLEPAIDLAADGLIIDQAFASALARARDSLADDDPFVTELCFRNGSSTGERFRLESLARTLRQIGMHGPTIFYEGRLASRIASAISERGGLLTETDLREHSSVFEPALTVRYHSANVSVTPPVSMGWILLQQMLLYEQLGGTELEDTAERVDLMVRCKHAAFSDLATMTHKRQTSDADNAEDAKDVEYAKDVEHLEDVKAVLRPDELDRWCSHITAQRSPAPVTATAAGTDTTCLSVVDSRGLMVTFIHSLFNEFGSRVVVPGTGIVLNDRLARQPASIAGTPGKPLPPRARRPLHTLMAYCVEHADWRLTGATPGGRGQVQTNFQVLQSILDDGAEPQAAVDRPRWRSGAARMPDSDNMLFMEPGFPDGVASELATRGHDVVTDTHRAKSDLFGSCTIAGVRTQTAEVFAAADHRRGAKWFSPPDLVTPKPE